MKIKTKAQLLKNEKLLRNKLRKKEIKLSSIQNNKIQKTNKLLLQAFYKRTRNLQTLLTLKKNNLKILTLTPN